jgi:hypothetical protein
LIVYLRSRLLRAIINSGVTGNFIDIKVVSENGFKAFKKERLYILSIVNGEQIRSNKGIVIYKTDLLSIKTLRRYTEEIQFDLVTIGIYVVILGIP